MKNIIKHHSHSILITIKVTSTDTVHNLPQFASECVNDDDHESQDSYQDSVDLSMSHTMLVVHNYYKRQHFHILLCRLVYDALCDVVGN
jgi:hypothetical protein